MQIRHSSLSAACCCTRPCRMNYYHRSLLCNYRKIQVRANESWVNGSSAAVALLDCSSAITEKAAYLTRSCWIWQKHCHLPAPAFTAAPCTSQTFLLIRSNGNFFTLAPAQHWVQTRDILVTNMQPVSINLCISESAETRNKEDSSGGRLDRESLFKICH